MPFVRASFSCGLSREQERELKKGFGEAIAAIPGKNEGNLLLLLEPDVSIFLAGDDTLPAAYVDAAVFGNESHEGFDRFSQEIASLLLRVTGIRPDRLYIRFSDIQAFSQGPQFFDRRWFS